ncbi:Uma2 family endonuclease [Tautonia sp. JC769]|uniref:Uma2 family endonuclease n=1 Tax=Tautonia sp. JC769 TaxID=3232135 RepID=UPI0034591391
MATAASTTTGPGRTGSSVRPLPPLENGDRLTRAEFERRYDAMPELKKAELIEGVVYMGSPVRLRNHGRPHSHLVTWLGTYEAATQGVLVADNATVRLDLDNEPQPDILLMIDPSRGGQARISDDDYIEGAPELVVEIASSSVSLDLNAKLQVYRRSNVREYLTWRVLDGAIDWRVLRDDRYELIPADDRGRLRSTVFPGLWLDPSALLRGDLTAVLAALGAGLADPEHAAFVDRLRG